MWRMKNVLCLHLLLQIFVVGVICKKSAFEGFFDPLKHLLHGDEKHSSKQHEATGSSKTHKVTNSKIFRITNDPGDSHLWSFHFSTDSAHNDLPGLIKEAGESIASQICGNKLKAESSHKEFGTHGNWDRGKICPKGKRCKQTSTIGKYEREHYNPNIRCGKGKAQACPEPDNRRTQQDNTKRTQNSWKITTNCKKGKDCGKDKPHHVQRDTRECIIRGKGKNAKCISPSEIAETSTTTNLRTICTLIRNRNCKSRKCKQSEYVCRKSRYNTKPTRTDQNMLDWKFTQNDKKDRDEIKIEKTQNYDRLTSYNGQTKTHLPNDKSYTNGFSYSFKWPPSNSKDQNSVYIKDENHKDHYDYQYPLHTHFEKEHNIYGDIPQDKYFDFHQQINGYHGGGHDAWSMHNPLHESGHPYGALNSGDGQIVWSGFEQDGISHFYDDVGHMDMHHTESHLKSLLDLLGISDKEHDTNVLHILKQILEGSADSSTILKGLPDKAKSQVKFLLSKIAPLGSSLKKQLHHIVDFVLHEKPTYNQDGEKKWTVGELNSSLGKLLTALSTPVKQNEKEGDGKGLVELLDVKGFSHTIADKFKTLLEFLGFKKPQRDIKTLHTLEQILREGPDSAESASIKEELSGSIRSRIEAALVQIEQLGPKLSEKFHEILDILLQALESDYEEFSVEQQKKIKANLDHVLTALISKKHNVAKREGKEKSHFGLEDMAHLIANKFKTVLVMFSASSPEHKEDFLENLKRILREKNNQKKHHLEAEFLEGLSGKIRQKVKAVLDRTVAMGFELKEKLQHLLDNGALKDNRNIGVQRVEDKEIQRSLDTLLASLGSQMQPKEHKLMFPNGVPIGETVYFYPYSEQNVPKKTITISLPPHKTVKLDEINDLIIKRDNGEMSVIPTFRSMIKTGMLGATVITYHPSGKQFIIQNKAMYTCNGKISKTGKCTGKKELFKITEMEDNCYANTFPKALGYACLSNSGQGIYMTFKDRRLICETDAEDAEYMTFGTINKICSKLASSATYTFHTNNSKIKSEYRCKGKNPSICEFHQSLTLNEKSAIPLNP